MIANPPSASVRLLGVAYYLGLAPVARFWRCRLSNPFLQHHQSQAIVAFFCLLLLLLLLFLLDNAESVFVILFQDSAKEVIDRWGSVAVYVDYAIWLLIGSVSVLWMTFVGLALAGSAWQVPLLKRLTRKPSIVRFSFFANACVLALIPLVTLFAFHATSLTRRSSETAAVYFLYDEGVWVPRWAFAMGLYRISLQAQQTWGTEGVVLDRMTKENLRVALANGKVVILASHGSDGYAETHLAPEILSVWPPTAGMTDETKSPRFLHASVLGADKKWGQAENVAVNGHLQLAYIFACDGGKKASQWQEHLAPAQVITYNRLSTLWDHALWFALTGPAKVQQLK